MAATPATIQSPATDPPAPAGLLPLPIGAPGRVPEWVMLARAGAWLGHPSVPDGREVVTPERLGSAFDYFERHYASHGADLVIDYHHGSISAPHTGTRAPAAGWINAMELRAGGAELWGRVLWTAEAAAAIAARQYRHLSPVLRFDAPDRVSGLRVPMFIHSVALTNTPFLTELGALNQHTEAAAMEGGGPGPTGRAHPHSASGGSDMSLLDGLAAALRTTPEQAASRLGLEAGADDGALAETLTANAAAARDLEAMAGALGLPNDAAPTQIRAAVIRLKADRLGTGEMGAVRARLALPETATAAEVLNAVEALQKDRGRMQAEELVENAVAAGKVPPAHRDFYLREAMTDLEAAREVINSLPVLMQAPPAGPRRSTVRLTPEEESVCAQLGLDPERFAASREL